MTGNCPSCGAPITGSACEYCGRVFEETPDAFVEGLTTPPQSDWMPEFHFTVDDFKLDNYIPLREVRESAEKARYEAREARKWLIALIGVAVVLGAGWVLGFIFGG